MVSLNQVEQQLKRVGCNFRFWGRAEIRELCNVLMPQETIAHCVNGHYEGGFAMLCVTDQRLLLIDRKPMFMAMEDIRFDMIAELDYSRQLLSSTIHIATQTSKLRFSSWNQHHLREVLNYTQQRMLDLRQQFAHQMQQAQAVASMGGQWVSRVTAGSTLGEVALQSASGASPSYGYGASWSLPLNPYANKKPMVMRRSSYPKFF